MAEADHLFTITLPSWPNCNDCLSWSEDDIAVAGSEVVHILTPKHSFSKQESAGHPHWQVLTLRVNLFSQDEWPEQSVATISEVSIGEEQSNSLVVGLEWSRAGLAPHQRSILAVLTSNLLLSFWELEEADAHYQRTCIVNNEVALSLKSEDDRDVEERRAMRIRNFTWSPVLRTTPHSRRSFHYLIVADGRNNIIWYQVSKSRTKCPGSWVIEHALLIDLPCYVPDEADTQLRSPLQQKIARGSAITKITIQPWETIVALQEAANGAQADGSVGMHSSRTAMLIEKGNQRFTLAVQASFLEEGAMPTLSLVGSIGSKTGGKAFGLSSASVCNPSTDGSELSIAPETFFQEQLQPLQMEFDSTFQLFGHFRTRIWGVARSVDGTKAAACLTLHPSDMIEYTIPSAERCTIVFKTIAQVDAPDKTAVPLRTVQENILQVARKFLEHGVQLDSPIDQRLHRVYLQLADVILDAASELRMFLSSQKTTDGLGSVNPGQQNLNNHNESIELCEICGDVIVFSTDTTAAECQSGHQFGRCQLSFLAIQEPGISKYCSGCGKQFLHLEKLGSFDGQSLVQAVFDEFDTCPYCQAKFRG